MSGLDYDPASPPSNPNAPNPVDTTFVKASPALAPTTCDSVNEAPGYKACSESLSPNDPRYLSAVDTAADASAAADGSTAGPLGGLCQELTGRETLVFNRFESCRAFFHIWTLYFGETPVGQSWERYYFRQLLQDGKSRTWVLQTAAYRTKATGQEDVPLRLGLRITNLDGLEAVDSPFERTSEVAVHHWLNQKWTLRSNGTSLLTHSLQTQVERKHPSSAVGKWDTARQPDVRCDSGTNSGQRTLTGAGCVHSLFRPSTIFQRTGGDYYFPQVWDNIHSGITNDGQPTVLTRDQDITRTRARRDAATANCPVNTDRAFQCDEYPFASTWEGGSTSTVRLVDAYQNSQHGNAYLAEIQKNRIISDEQFVVRLVLY